MKLAVIIVSVMTLSITVTLTMLAARTFHHCTWDECPNNETYEEYSDSWCIQDLHARHPDWTYEECEGVLLYDVFSESN